MPWAAGGARGIRAAELVPARMLNEHAYCPRLAYLEWVQGDFADSADTVDGRFHHRRVDKETGMLPGPDELEGVSFHARSVQLSAPRIGLIARIDLIEADGEADGEAVTPIDYKRGMAPDVPEGAWEPERVQLCAQALILEEHGYRVGADPVLRRVAPARGDRDRCCPAGADARAARGGGARCAAAAAGG